MVDTDDNSSTGPDCPVCEARDGQSREPYNGYEMRECARCDLVFTLQRQFPPSVYDQLYAGDEGYLHWMRLANDAMQRQLSIRDIGWFRWLALRWLRRLPTETTLLDVGCGAGVFMGLAQQAGYQVSGLEPAKAAADKAQSLGLDVQNAYVEDLARSSSTRFGVIVCFEVLEHVPRPVDMLRAMHSLLVPDGYLIVSVPNAGDPYCLDQVWPNAMPPVHINFFNRNSLANALQRARFQVHRIRSPLVPTTTVKSLYGTKGLMLRVPYLLALRLLGRSDGSGILALAQRG